MSKLGTNVIRIETQVRKILFLESDLFIAVANENKTEVNLKQVIH